MHALESPSEPPDTVGNEDENEENEWIQDVMFAMSNENDKCTKPTIAKLHFEKQNRPILYDCKDEVPPYQYLDEDDRVINKFEAYHDFTDIQHNHDLQHYGEILTGDEMEKEEQDDPFINLLKNSGTLNRNKRWKPGLDSIKEEKKHEINTLKRYNDDGCMYVYNKRLKNKVTKISARINKTMASQKGLYRVRVNTQQLAQNDGGANRSVTGVRNLLVHFHPIEPYAIGGVNDKEPAIYCTGVGYLPWKADTGEITMVKCYYCPDVKGTILSPTDIVVLHKERFSGWDMDADCDSGLGEFQLKARDGVSHITFDMFMENNLWFHYLDPLIGEEQQAINFASKASIKALTDTAQYELWHHRLGHPGTKVTEMIHKHVEGVPKLRPNQFYFSRKSQNVNAKYTWQHSR